MRSRAITLELSIFTESSISGAMSRTRSTAAGSRSKAGPLTAPTATAPRRPWLEVAEFALGLGELLQQRAGVARQRRAERRQPHAARQPLAQAAPRTPPPSRATMRDAAGCDRFSVCAAALTEPESSMAAISRKLRQA